MLLEVDKVEALDELRVEALDVDVDKVLAVLGDDMLEAVDEVLSVLAVLIVDAVETDDSLADDDVLSVLDVLSVDDDGELSELEVLNVLDVLNVELDSVLLLKVDGDDRDVSLTELGVFEENDEVSVDTLELVSVLIDD